MYMRIDVHIYVLLRHSATIEVIGIHKIGIYLKIKTITYVLRQVVRVSNTIM